MEQYRRRRHGRKKTFHGQYGTIDPARTVAGRSARHVTNPRPRRGERAQYVSRRAHAGGTRRGARGLSARTVLVAAAILIAIVALVVFLFTRPASAVITTAPGDATILFNGSIPGTGALEVAHKAEIAK